MNWLLTLIFAGTCYAAPVFVQIASCNQQAGATGCTPTMGSNLGAGNTLFVFKQNYVVAYAQGSGTVPTIAGSFCYTLRTADVNLNLGPSTGAILLDSWICPNIAGGTTTGPTINAGQASTSFSGFVLEFSGLGTWPVFDQAPSTWPIFGTAGGYGSCVSSCSATMTAGATTTAGGLLIAYGGQQNSGVTTCTAGSGFTIPSGGQIASANSIACVEYNLASAGGSTTANLTVNVAGSYGLALLSLVAGNTPYFTNQPGPANGYFVTHSNVNAVPSHSGATITEAFPTMAIAPNGDVLMAYEQNSPGQGSGPNSAAALRFATAASCATTCSWSDYSGPNYGTDCAGHPWFAGCLFSGDGANGDSHWFPGYNGLLQNGTKYYYEVTVESNVPACVNALLSISTTPEASWPSPTAIEGNAACWIGPLIFINNPTTNANCLNGCIIAPIQENAGATKLFYSTDGGATWPNSVTVNNGSVIFNQLEVFMWYNGGNQLIGVARSNSQQSYRVFFSNDLGNTWGNGGYANILTGGPLNSAWTLTSPVVIFPNLGDGNVSLLFTDRGNNTTRVTNASTSTLLNSPQLISQGQTLNYGAGNSGGNTFGYPTAVSLGSNQWLFAWYAANGSNNGQIFTVLGTYTFPSSFPKVLFASLGK